MRLCNVTEQWTKHYRGQLKIFSFLHYSLPVTPLITTTPLQVFRIHKWRNDYEFLYSAMSYSTTGKYSLSFRKRFYSSWSFNTLRWEQQVPSKRREVPTQRRSITFQKTGILDYTSQKNSKLRTQRTAWCRAETRRNPFIYMCIHIIVSIWTHLCV